MGKRLTDANRLSLHNPDVAAEWHPDKNGALTPHDVSYGSGKRVWWLCPEGHERQTVVSYRTLDGTGCRFCAGQGVSDNNRLSLHYPDLAKQWHPSKNGDLTPHDVSRGRVLLHFAG